MKLDPDKKVGYFVRQIESGFAYWVDGDWDTIAFLAEHPSNPYLVRWGWWDE